MSEFDVGAAVDQAAAGTPPAEPPPSEIPAPQGWDAPAQERWGKFDPDTRKFISEREANFTKDIEKYRGGWEANGKFEKAIEPYMPVIKQYNADPFTITQNLMGAHFALSFGTPEQKLDMVRYIVQSYGMDAPAVIATLQGAAPPQSNAEVVALKKEIADLKTQFGGVTQYVTQSQKDQVERTISEFSGAKAEDGKPAHPYFDLVQDEMAKQINADRSMTLQQAYDRACWLNPDVRDKLVKDMHTVAPLKGKPNAVNVKTNDSPVVSPDRFAGMSMWDALAAKGKEIYSK